MEHQAPDPVVVADQRLDARSATIPKSDSLISGSRRHELGRAAGWRSLLQSSHGRKVLVRRRGGKSAALDAMLVTDHDHLCLWGIH